MASAQVQGTRRIKYTPEACIRIAYYTVPMVISFAHLSEDVRVHVDPRMSHMPTSPNIQHISGRDSNLSVGANPYISQHNLATILSMRPEASSAILRKQPAIPDEATKASLVAETLDKAEDEPEYGPTAQCIANMATSVDASLRHDPYTQFDDYLNRQMGPAEVSEAALGFNSTSSAPLTADSLASVQVDAPLTLRGAAGSYAGSVDLITFSEDEPAARQQAGEDAHLSLGSASMDMSSSDE